MSSLQIGRLVIGPPLVWDEQLGDPITNLGGAAVPQVRSALRHAVSIATLAADGNPDTLAARLTIRRQLRSLLNNTPLKLQGGFYVVYSDDPENSGWYVPDQGQLSSLDGASGLATGAWQAQNIVWMLAGHMRINKEARNVWLKDLRGGLNPRDTLRLILSTDFSALPAVALTVLPNGAVRPRNTLTGAVVTTASMPTGRDGGTAQLAVGLSDLASVSYDRPESALNLSDVIAYDRRGGGDAPATGPGPTWEEAYGPDHQWAWIAATPVADAPVLDNGLVRVRWDGTNTPGFRVDVWNGSAYVEQGKMIVQRIGDTSNYCDTWIAAGLYTDDGWSPDRSVVDVTLCASADPYSAERVFITLQRGEMSVGFEVYPAAKSNGTNADAWLQWTPALNSGAADLNESVFKSDTTTLPPAVGNVKNAATAGTGAGAGNSGQYPGGFATLGAANFTSSENWVAILRCPTAYATIGPYQQALVVLQAAGALIQYAGSDSHAYGTATDAYAIESQSNAGYIQAQVSFAATRADQVMEAEAMTLGAGTTAGGDPSASGSATTQATRTTDANAHVSRASWPNGFLGQYRVFARVKTTATQGSVYAKTGATTGATVTFAGAATPTHQWVDLGSLATNNSSLELHAWISSGSGVIEVDRIEAILEQDRVRTGALYLGCRDVGQAALYDARATGALVSR